MVLAYRELGTLGEKSGFIAGVGWVFKFDRASVEKKSTFSGIKSEFGHRVCNTSQDEDRKNFDSARARVLRQRVCASGPFFCFNPNSQGASDVQAGPFEGDYNMRSTRWLCVLVVYVDCACLGLVHCCFLRVLY